jgi:RHS repeat-associated protein
MLGTPRLITDGSGSVKARHDYLPFGEEIGLTGGRTNQQRYVVDDIKQKFTQKERDNETGLDYFGARYYSSVQGRFTSADPIVIHLGRMLEPYRLNLYSYSRNNPLRFIDPNGLDDIVYDQSGREVERKKRSKWHNFWHGDTWKIKTDRGKIYNLDGPLKQLPEGQRYTIVSARGTQRLMEAFVDKHERQPGDPAVGYKETAKKSVDPEQWNWKVKLNERYGANALFIFQGTAHRSDYIGNVAWGYIMASNGYWEVTAKAGAGLQQMSSDQPFEGSAFDFYDDPRDQEAISKGFEWYAYMDEIRTDQAEMEMRHRDIIPMWNVKPYQSPKFPPGW